MVAILCREWVTEDDLPAWPGPRSATNSKIPFNKFEHGLAAS
jgi:hypothetical protein